MPEPLELADLLDDAAFHRRIVESTHDCVAVLDLDGRLLFLTARGQELLGLYDLGALINQPWIDIWDEPWRGMAASAVASARAGRRGTFQGYYRTADGRPTWWDVVVTPIDGQTGGASALLAISRDITAQKEALDALHEAQAKMIELRQQLANFTRLTMFGTLTASIAHELMQPLTAIMSNARAAHRLVSQTTPDLGQVAAALDDIVRDDQRASGIIEHFRSLLKRGSASKQLCDLNVTIEDVLTTLRAEAIERRVVLSCRFDETPSVWADRVQLQQLVLNLVMNAIDAVAAAAPPSRHVTVSTRQLGTRGVVVSVENDGAQIAPEEIARLWQPFYTTKPQGLGLGLAICREILDAHHSELRAERRAAGGLIFSFTLRSSKRVAAARRALAGVSAPRAARSSLRST
jgi:PAS domain S-box-containing protein